MHETGALQSADCLNPFRITDERIDLLRILGPLKCEQTFINT